MTAAQFNVMGSSLMKEIFQPLELRTAVVGPWSLNAYALICPQSGQSVLIDPGAEPQTLLGLLAGSRPTAILVTHSHPDHIGALAQLRQTLKVPVMAHPGADQSPVCADVWLQGGERIPVGDHQLRVFYTPGHTDDQICFGMESDNKVIVGDTIFEGGPGKTWSERDFQTTLDTFRRTVVAWPDDTVCYPGHGPFFRLGDQRHLIEVFLAKDHGAFFGDATWRM
jgi:hydroxyacylglutathione hydrolase